MADREWEPGMVPVDAGEMAGWLCELLGTQAPQPDNIEPLYGAEWRLVGAEVRYGEHRFVITVEQATEGDKR